MDFVTARLLPVFGFWLFRETYVCTVQHTCMYIDFVPKGATYRGTISRTHLAHCLVCLTTGGQLLLLQNINKGRNRTDRKEMSTPAIRLLVLLLAYNVISITSSINCVAEFETCVMSRDCCGDIECVAGDWAVTTDSTCLSKRSQAFDALSEDKRLDLITRFYDETSSEKEKTAEDIKSLVKKNSNSFSKLIYRLERKYKVSVDRRDEL
mmetsp:Transcript_28382/g.41248  ORF Transcript_28382/g.41248 Transcript_28382/m.41248 type:complete len:209 (+) Transcript_28382:1366-1992(+)